MPDYEVRIAAKSEIKPVMEMLIRERSRYSSFASLLKSPLRRLMYEKWVLPRYLRNSVNTFVMLQDKTLAGYAVAEQSGPAVHLADFVAVDGFDRGPLLALLFQKVEQMAAERDYRFLRASPWEADDETMAAFEAAGFRLLDYYLWAFRGVAAGVEPPEKVSLRPLGNRTHAEQRERYLLMELDASAVEGREMIEAVFLRRRLPPYKAYVIELEDTSGETREIGYLSPRPNERSDGVLTLALGLDPAYWGSELETAIVGGFLSEVNAGAPKEARLLVSTSTHADRIESAMAGLGLRREMDLRPVLYKILGGARHEPAGQTKP